MNDDLTPSFQEPEGVSGQDELAGDAPEEHDPFNLHDWLEEGTMPLGFLGVLKFLDTDGAMKSINMQVFIHDFEALGMLQRAQHEINNRIDIESYIYNSTPDDEEE